MPLIFGLCAVVLLGLTTLLFSGFTRRDRAVLLSRFKRMEHDGLKRAYLVWQPGQTERVDKIIVSCHGFTDNARRHAYYTALHNCVDERTTVIYPQSVKPSKKGVLNGWNAGFCCGSGWVQKADDVGFCISLIKEYRDKFGVKSENVFLSGFSNGAMLVQKIATEHPEMIGGISSVSGTIGANDCRLKPHRAVPVLMVHGLKDKNIPFNGGLGVSQDFTWRSFDDNLKAWQKANHSAEKPTAIENYGNKIVREYNGKKSLTAITYQDGGHLWPGWRLWQLNRRRPECSQIVIDFFYRQKG